MAAAYLDAALNEPDHKVADITLLESPDMPRIGVGEATIPSINHVLATIGINEIEFLKRVDGSFKHAIKFVNWLDDRGGHYYHAFGRRRQKPIDYSAGRWLRSDRSIPFSETISAQPLLCEANLGPHPFPDNTPAPHFAYAFHMDALKFADYLCEIATSRGVTHHLDTMIDAELSDDGNIKEVLTSGGLRLEADLFIDCTGFAARLIEKKLNVEWLDCSQWLLNDRAVTINIPYEDSYPGFVHPYTTATALSAGWVWQIPLQTRRAFGYVHSSSYISEDQAERELRTFIGKAANRQPANIIPFKVGYRAKSWVKNCVAIGLAAGFVEPLESTGLYLSDLASVLLAEHFPYHGDMTPLAFRYNRIMADRYHEILDFINLHYCLTRRTDTDYWREIRHPQRTRSRVQAKLDYWRLKPPSYPDFEDASFPGEQMSQLVSGGLPGDHRPPVDTAGVFGLSSYEAILYGMDFLRDECKQWYGADLPSSRILEPVAQRQQAAQSRLPSHASWLQQVCGMQTFPTR